MLLFTATSAKCKLPEDEIAKPSRYGEVMRLHGRYVVDLFINNIEEVPSFWPLVADGSFFGTSARVNRVSVRFGNVKCASVNGSTDWELNQVIMKDPGNPIHSGLFPFFMKIDLDSHRSIAPERSIEVGVDGERIKPENIEMFARLLRICQREFRQPGKNVHFRGRKQTGKTKRAYILKLWLTGKLPPDLEPLFRQYAGRVQTMGKYLGAEAAWDALVAREQELQSL